VGDALCVLRGRRIRARPRSSGSRWAAAIRPGARLARRRWWTGPPRLHPPGGHRRRDRPGGNCPRAQPGRIRPTSGRGGLDFVYAPGTSRADIDADLAVPPRTRRPRRLRGPGQGSLEMGWIDESSGPPAAPTLLVHGEVDRWCRPRTPAHGSRDPGARLEVIPDASTSSGPTSHRRRARPSSRSARLARIRGPRRAPGMMGPMTDRFAWVRIGASASLALVLVVRDGGLPSCSASPSSRLYQNG